MVQKINIEKERKNWVYFSVNGIIERERRPFKNANEYAEEQIKIWNGQTKEGDIIKHLGD